MAEVKLEITAEDAATPKIRALDDAVRSAARAVEEMKGKGLFSELDGTLRKPVTLAFSLDAAGAIESAREARAAIDSIALAPKSLVLDASQAMRATDEARKRIDAHFPDTGIHKYVYVHYQSVASPAMPFTEGIAHIKDMMESLPKTTLHRVRYDFGGTGARGAETSHPTAPPIAVTLNMPAVNISGGGGEGGLRSPQSLAREIDTEFAEIFRTGRSRLLAAVRENLGGTR